MLKLKHSHRFLPKLSVVASQMQFKPVTVDDDELTEAIVTDQAAHDDQWELSERPEIGQLTKFWEDVEEDVSKDPEWFRFSQD